MRAECACGAILEGDPEDVAEAMVRHAADVHGRPLALEQARQMLHPT